MYLFMPFYLRCRSYSGYEYLERRFDLKSRLQIPDEHKKPMGRMAFTAVYELEATWGDVARTRVVGQAEIVRRERR